MADTNLNVVISADDKASPKLKGFKESIRATSADIRKMGIAMTTAAAAIGAGLGIAVKEFADFEAGMSSVKAITNASGEDLERMTDLAKEMGRTTVFSAKQASEAMKFLGMAGFTTEEIMESLQGTLNLAAASGIELGRAADIASNILTGFRLEATESERVVDLLAKTVTSSNTDMEQMAEAMKFLAPTAASFGVSIEESAAVIGILGNAGLQGSIATRALATSLNRLAKPTKAMRSVMEDLNLEFFNTEGEFIGISQTALVLEEALVGATDKQKAATISTIFGQQALKQWNILLAESSENIDIYANELEDAGGTAQRMADTQLDNLSGSFALLTSAVSGFLIEAGSQLAPILRSITEGITDVTSRVTTWMEQNPVLTERLVKVAAVIGAILAVTGPLLIVIGLMAPAFTVIAGVISAVTAVLGLLLGPVGLVIAIIAALIAVGVALVKNWTEVESAAMTVWTSISDFIQTKFNEIKEFFQAIWDGITLVFSTALAFLVGLVVSVFDIMGINIVEKLNSIKEGINSFLETVKIIWSFAWTLVKKITGKVWSEITGVVSTKMDEIVGDIKSFVQPIVDAFGLVWSGVEMGAKLAMDGLKFLIKGTINFIIDKINKFIQSVNSVVQRGAGVTGLEVSLIPEIPHFAEGGIVTGPTVGLIGEAGPEAVIPLSKMGSMGMGGNVTIIVNGDVSGEDLIQKVGDALTRNLQLSSAIV